MTDAGRQATCGIVVNAHPNIARADYDRLKAILHNAALRCPGEHSRADLLGRVAWVEFLNPARGAHLRAAFTAIHWGQTP